ncbi:peptidoglycan recognition protein family protein [Brachybacterium paraconglomeratum]|uniref:peptidoglycan recognition protein family protein n=1 Tax=Brachybacterium paraconglomeratum TaxID=173362 RepID=UPI0022AFB12F|nr:N-acetylmuramoyl-L-alanine amidase [Brachybacterium paraconglomeratum]MCZ4325213.1 N-acetylmuramoyl-L-alanine amidase [Brachybacterium paraconglomeratum]
MCDERAGTSAHYVVEAGRVACIVDPDRRAWHAGSSKGNHESIGIECRPEATEGDYATVAALVADLRAVYGDLPLKPHRAWTSTACPGVWDLGKIDRLARGVKAPVKVSSGGTSVPAAKPAVKDGKLVEDGRWGTVTTSALQRFLNAKVRAGLKVDGRTGPATWKALQRFLGHPVVDGVIEHQSYRHTELGNGISPNGWVFSGRKSKGSKTMRRLQKLVGVAQDGVVYEGTTKALQRWLNAQ